MRLVIKLIIIILLLAGGVYLYLQQGKTAKPDAKTDKDKVPVPVLVAKAETGELPIVVELVGRAEAYESVSLKARIDGQVQAVLFQEGQHVKAGDALVRLDPADFAARQKQAEATLARDQALLQKARADVARYATLQEQGFVSAEKLADLRAAEAAAEATVQADRAALELARLQLSYTSVRAPFEGVVGARLVFPGTAVKNNETELAVINRVQPLPVRFSLPEQHLDAMRAARAGKRLRAIVQTPETGGPEQAAEVYFVDNAVDPGTGTLAMKARIPNRDERFSPGQYLRVSLELDVLKDAVILPAEAIQQGGKGSVVYLVTADAGIEIRPVKIAAERAGRIAVTGVRAGETVITDGHLRLTPKSKVKVTSPDDMGGKTGKPRKG